MYTFNYHRPASIEEATDLFNAADDPVFLAGGHTLLPAMKQRLQAPSDIIDLGSVAGLSGIEVAADAITFTFLPTHRALHDQFNETRGWLESAAERLAGRRIVVTAVQAVEGVVADRSPASAVPTPPAEAASSETATPGARDLKAEAMSSSAVQAMLEVFPAEISDVEEM